MIPLNVSEHSESFSVAQHDSSCNSLQETYIMLECWQIKQSPFLVQAKSYK